MRSDKWYGLKRKLAKQGSVNCGLKENMPFHWPVQCLSIRTVNINLRTDNITGANSKIHGLNLNHTHYRFFSPFLTANVANKETVSVHSSFVFRTNSNIGRKTVHKLQWSCRRNTKVSEVVCHCWILFSLTVHNSKSTVTGLGHAVIKY